MEALGSSLAVVMVTMLTVDVGVDQGVTIGLIPIS